MRGPTRRLAAITFPESEILGEIDAQALEDGGCPVERTLDLGAREVIYSDRLEGSDPTRGGR
jgi:glycine betaine/choline ABC-type transport system substrate-binding protein